MSKNLELFPTETHLPTNMSTGIAVFTIQGVATKKKPCPIGLMVVANTTLVKASGRDTLWKRYRIFGKGKRSDCGAPHGRKEKLKAMETYVDRLNDQRIGKELEVSFLYIVIEDSTGGVRYCK
jgi:hypothetical protein